MRPRILAAGLTLAGIVALSVVGALSFDRWKGWLFHGPTEAKPGDAHAPDGSPDQIQLSPQAQANLRLRVQPVYLTSHWRTIQVPGQVAELPGKSDHAVTSPVAGVVKRIAVAPWDTVRPGDELFTLGLVSEFLQNAQADLFKTTRNLQINQEERDRLLEVSRTGAVPTTRLLELEYQSRRLQADALTYRYLLAARGLTPAQVQGVTDGKFVSDITIRVPGLPANRETLSPSSPQPYEVQELKVHLGEQVQAGQLLGFLTDHQSLVIEGHGFKQEVSLLERAARQGWLVRAEFSPDEGADWLPFRAELPALALAGLLRWPLGMPLLPPDGLLPIRFLANTVDPANQTFAFYMPLSNQYREYVSAGQTYRIWRFRPGQRVLLHVPVEQLEGVFVLPAEAVIREGAEMFVFRQKGDSFERQAVHVLHRDRRWAVLANDGSVSPGANLVHSAAAPLNLALKSQAASGDGGSDHHHDH